MKHLGDTFGGNIDDLSLGDCFAFHDRGQTYIAIAVESPDQRHARALIALWPNHPDLDEAGILRASVISQLPIAIFRDAMILPSNEIEDLRFGHQGYRAPAGALFMAGKEYVVTAFYNKDVIAYNARDGKASDASHDGLPWFSAWKIVRPGPGGEPLEVCTIKVKAPPYQA